MSRTQIILRSTVIAMVALYGVWQGVKWSVMRVFVPEDKALLVINKFGKDLPPGLVVVPKDDNHYKGVQEEVRGPGRYFIDPVEYTTELVDLVEIPAGDPEKWEWDADGHLKNAETAPCVGLVTLKQGKVPPPGEMVVGPEYKGIQRDVLTPGTYKINPKVEEITLVPAVVVPPGSVGVVTRLIGDVSEVESAPLSITGSGAATNPATNPAVPARVISNPTQRGILKDVLQAGIYYLNPRAVSVTVVPVGYDHVTLDHGLNTAVRFYTSDGYEVQADFTVVWGRTPADAPYILASIGDTKHIEQNVIEPAMKASCQNEGGKYSAQELIQGLTRSKFQDDLTVSLQQQVTSRNVFILLALVRNIAVKDTSGHDATEGLLATIQRANVEKERELTNKQKTETAAVKADLEQALKLVDVARQTVTSESGIKVAQAIAEGGKKAAEIDAQRDLDIARIQFQVSQLDAQRVQILGKAKADVEQMKNEAEAKGAKLLVDALGSPQAYNQYIFAKNFEPTELRLIFAGQGTFWTDLKSFQDVASGKLVQQSTEGAPAK